MKTIKYMSLYLSPYLSPQILSAQSDAPECWKLFQNVLIVKHSLLWRCKGRQPIITFFNTLWQPTSTSINGKLIVNETLVNSYFAVEMKCFLIHHYAIVVMLKQMFIYTVSFIFTTNYILMNYVLFINDGYYQMLFFLSIIDESASYSLQIILLIKC